MAPNDPRDDTLQHPADTWDTLPANLRPVHELLHDVSASWQRQLPSANALNAQLPHLLRDADGEHSPRQRGDTAAELRERRGVSFDGGGGAGRISGPVPSPSARTMHRWLSAVAALLLIALGASVFGVFAAHRPSSGTTAAHPTATPTVPLITSDPQDSGWTRFVPYVFRGDLALAPSDPARGYVCGDTGSYDPGRIFGDTTDGGHTWRIMQTPAKYSACSLQVSPSNPLNVALTSYVDAGQAPDLESHYSVDGGATWKPVPFPRSIVPPGGAAWSGSFLFAWGGPSTFYPQQNFLEVSAGGGAFTSIDTHALLPSAQHLGIEGTVVSGDRLYLNLSYSCGGVQSCQAIVASGNGGKSWTQIPNQSKIQLMAVAGNLLYGVVPASPSAVQTEMTTSDNGATWTPMKLPPIPGAPTGQAAPLALPAPDGTLFAAPDALGVAYLRGGTWTLLPFSQHGKSIRVAVAVDGSGKPVTVWAIDNGNDSAAGIYAGIYSHPLP